MAIYGYMGQKGNGKTYAAVTRLLSVSKQGYRVRSNLKSTWHWAEPVQTIEDIMEGKDCVTLLDELHLWIPAREYRTNPPELLAYLGMCRKEEGHIIYTSQFPEQADSHLRLQTDVWYSCKRRANVIMVTEHEAGPESKRVSVQSVVIKPSMIDHYDTYEKVSVRVTTKEGTEYIGGESGAGSVRQRRLWRESMLKKRPFGWRTERGVDVLFPVTSHSDFLGLPYVLIPSLLGFEKVECKHFSEP